MDSRAMRRATTISSVAVGAAAVLAGMVWAIGLAPTVSIVIVAFGVLMLSAAWVSSGSTWRTAVMLIVWLVCIVVVCWVIGVGR